MKLPITLGVSLLLLAAPLSAQIADYAFWTTRGASLMVQHADEVKRNVAYKQSEEDKAAQAGNAYLEASRLAQTNPEKFAALEAAGNALAESKIYRFRQKAADAYFQARDMVSIAPGARARVGLTGARRTGKKSDFEAVIAIAGVPDQDLATAHEAVSDKLTFVEKRPLDGAKELHNAVRYHIKTGELVKANLLFGIAAARASKGTPIEEALPILDSIYADWLVMAKRFPDEKSRTFADYSAQSNYASALFQLGELERALKMYRAIAQSERFDAEQRKSAEQKIAEMEVAKLTPEATQ